jgi:predicted aminopeptidase
MVLFDSFHFTLRRRTWKRLLILFLSALAIGSLWYLFEQGFFYIWDQLRALPNPLVVKRFPEYEIFLKEAEAIREYGLKEIGLASTRSYTRFILARKDYVATVVSAVRPTSFESKVWRFPVVGTVPYRGFYRESAARREAARLEAQGWETFTRRVGAFSSLGYFSDPLYSYMANYDPERLVSMILHEMTHATVWYSNDPQLSEAVATYIGTLGARDYLIDRYGPASDVFVLAMRRQSDRETFSRFMRQLASRLAVLYKSGAPVEELLIGRDLIINEERARYLLNYDLWFNDPRYQGFLGLDINNAYIDLYRMYNTDIDLLASIHAQRGDSLREFVAFLVSLSSEPDPRSILE